eukprot:scaffold2351_cov254-Chaetoceros_neogracile.AAC.13
MEMAWHATVVELLRKILGYYYGFEGLFRYFYFCPTDSDTFNIWKTKGKGEGGNESADRQATSSRSEKREKHVEES